VRLEDGKNKKVLHYMDWLPAPHLEQKINIRISVVGGFRGGGGGLLLPSL
jgi:hypothetical protein